MGGGGGFSPISIISDILFSSVAGALGAGVQSGGATSESTDTSAVEEAEARRKADRKKAEASLLAKARQSDRAEQSNQDAVAETLGAPNVASVQLKQRLGQ